jgi:hypothetical protein
MKFAQFAILGTILQGAFLIAFILVSRGRFAGVGKPLVITLACLSVTLILGVGVRNAKDSTSLCLLPVMLAVGYVIAFHLVGEIGFPGLLFLTWDEAERADGPIGMILLSPLAKGNGYSNSIHYDHGALLRTLEVIFGVAPYLGSAANQPDLKDLFSAFP